MTPKTTFSRTLTFVRRIAAVAALVTTLILPAHAQTPGNIEVTVKTRTGDAVKGATITVQNDVTFQLFPATTDAKGTAIIPNLPPGLYSVKANAPGFDEMSQTNVRVEANKRTSIKFTAEPAFGAAPTGDVQTEVIDTLQELSSLPNLNNDLTPLLQIVPGAVATGSASLGRVIVDGRGIDQQTARLDGVDFTSLVDFPSADAAINPVSSFQKPEVAGDLDRAATRSGAAGYEPRYGPGTGSVSETSTFRGSRDNLVFQIFSDLRNNALNARNFFDYDGDNALRRTRFGGKVGHVLDDKKRWLIFFAYDGSRGRTERNVYEAVPLQVTNGTATGPLASIASDFLPSGTSLVSKASLNPDFLVASRRLRTTVSSNAWDTRFDYFPKRPIDGKCPAPNAPGTCNVLTIRLTHQVAENEVPEGITGRSQLQRFFFTNALVGWKSVKTTKPILSEFPDKRGDKEFGHQLRFGFNQTRAETSVERLATANPTLAQSIVVTQGTVRTQGLRVTPPLEGQTSTVPIAAPGGLLQTAGRGLYLKPQSFSGIYDYSRLVTKDKMHELFAGIEARFIRFNFDRRGGLTYTFRNAADLRAGTLRNVLFASDLSGASPFSEGTGPRQARQEMYMGYVQMVSQFRPSGQPDLEPKITLTYGVRYDHFGRVRERDNRAVVVDPLTGVELPRGTDFYRVDHVNFQPRVALSYRLSNEGAGRYTVLRAGVGLYSGVPRISDLTLPIESDRFSTGIDGGTFPMPVSDVVRSFIEKRETRQFQPLAFARDFSPLERSLKWDVRLTRSIKGYDFSAYYLGSMSRNLALANFANRIVSVNTNADPTKDAIVVREFDIVNGNSVSQPLGEFFYRTGGGSSTFNALTLQLARDTLDGLRDSPWGKLWLKLPVTNFTLKYTLSRSVGNVSGALLSNPLDPDADFGNNSGVARHSFLWTTAYELWRVTETNPGHFWLGWKLNSTLRVTSGVPFSVRIQRPDVVYVDGSGNVFTQPAAGRTARLNTPGGGGSASAFMPNLLPLENPYKGGSADRLFLNAAAFAIPEPGKLGNARRGQFFGPGFVQFDLGIRRNFFGTERTLGEFQVEIFNVFNHTNFSNPVALLTSPLGTSTADNQLQPRAAFTRGAAGSFGVINAAETGRIIQFSFTLKFNKGFTK
ncbi:MAG TPA: carboxypeptidase-like regulatory domain-containing protein [Pyrinomonadaceae bacterium]|nr:carboxypeptidase-like regulatory domain-containing protein [Pyrinomonadaceae bacterium]